MPHHRARSHASMSFEKVRSQQFQPARPNPPFDRRILVMRHGERVDAVFGKTTGPNTGWTSKAFEGNSYKYFDCNMPAMLPKRTDGVYAWSRDPSLTEMGYVQAKLTGRAVSVANVKVDVIVTSPALRCVRTAVGFIKGQHLTSKPGTTYTHKGVAIEPGLFEFGYFMKPETTAPVFMTTQELKSSYSVNIDEDYTPYMPLEKLNPSESLLEFHERSYRTVLHILKQYPQAKTILLSTHAPNFEPLTRQLCHKPPRSWEEYKMPMRTTPYAAIILAQEYKGKWSMGTPPVPPFTHGMSYGVDEYYQTLN